VKLSPHFGAHQRGARDEARGRRDGSEGVAQARLSAIGCASWSGAGEILEKEKGGLRRLMTLEMGKPLRAAIDEASKCATVAAYYANHATTFLADERGVIDGEDSYVAFQPLGAILAVMPWNFPFWQVIRLRRQRSRPATSDCSNTRPMSRNARWPSRSCFVAPGRRPGSSNRC